VIVTFVEITSLVDAERQHLVLIHELNHRVRNMLTVVRAIANQTLAPAPTPTAFFEAFEGRIDAVTRAYVLVVRQRWGHVALGRSSRRSWGRHRPCRCDLSLPADPSGVREW
jgi:two-component system CheB/CheR fusion protein